MNFSILLWAPGISEIILILVAIVFLFGGKKIPELMRGLGNGIREFNNAKDKGKDELNQGMKNPNSTNNKENSNDKAE